MDKLKILPVKNDIVFRLFFAIVITEEELIKNSARYHHRFIFYDPEAGAEEELNMVAERNPQVKSAVVTLRKLSADEQVRDMYEHREKAMRDLDSRERQAEEKGRVEGRVEVASNLLSLKLPLEDIITATGLTREEIDKLQKR